MSNVIIVMGFEDLWKKIRSFMCKTQYPALDTHTLKVE